MSICFFYLAANSLLLLSLYQTVQRTNELVVVLLVLCVASVTYSGVMWGTPRHALDFAPLKENAIDFIFHALTCILAAVFNLQLLRNVTIPTYVAVWNLVPFATHGATFFLQKPRINRDDFRGSEKLLGALALGLLVYMAPSLFTASPARASRAARVGWSLLYIASAAMRKITHARLPNGVAYDTLHTTEQIACFLFTLIYCLTFKAFDETATNDFNRAANYLAISCVLHVFLDWCNSQIHAFNQEHQGESPSGSFFGTPVSMPHVTYYCRVVVVVFGLVTMTPFDGIITAYMAGHALMFYAGHTSLTRYKDEQRAAVNLIELGKPKEAPMLADRRALEIEEERETQPETPSRAPPAASYLELI
jgi:hypothetical protein